MACDTLRAESHILDSSNVHLDIIKSLSNVNTDMFSP